MLSQEAVQEILGIEEGVATSPSEMAKSLTVTFFPFEKAAVSSAIVTFQEDLEKAFVEVGVRVIPFRASVYVVPLQKTIKRLLKILGNNTLYLLERVYHKEPERTYINWGAIQNLLRRTRIKKGVSVIACGESEIGKLPMDFTSSFRESSVITILDRPLHISGESNFFQHFDTALDLFAHHMTNIVIAVTTTEWTLYNFNASHPTYKRTEDLKPHILHALIPKIAAPIRPNQFSEFVVGTPFNPEAAGVQNAAEDIKRAGTAFQSTDLFPAGKKISDLPFRNSYYHWIGKIHLDQRNGMSYGFLAYQLAAKLGTVYEVLGGKVFGVEIPKEKDYFYYNDELYITLEVLGKVLCLKVPEVWVLTQRSGSNKTNIDMRKDLLLLGLQNGKMHLRPSQYLKITPSYKPSFDTRVILAHAVGNAIVASILKHMSGAVLFAKTLEKNGIGISHWHGYINAAKIPVGWHVHGSTNPHVACSSPQSAIYALEGKLEAFARSLRFNLPFLGDVHIEPHHGTNITFLNLQELAKFLKQNEAAVSLGNKFLPTYSYPDASRA